MKHEQWSIGQCNRIGVPDECDIASGTSQDLKINNIPTSATAE